MDELFCIEQLVEIATLSKELKMYEILAHDELLQLDEASLNARKSREIRFAEILTAIENHV